VGEELLSVGLGQQVSIWEATTYCFELGINLAVGGP
jgi:hypothetical protein